MTTVAYRDGVLAADTQGNLDDRRTVVTKIFLCGDSVIGAAGNVPDVRAFVEWWRNGRRGEPRFRQYAGEKDAPEFDAIVAYRDVRGAKRPPELWNQWLHPRTIREAFFALGTGGAAAMGAMHMGADAFKAVEIAGLVDIQTGPNVESYRI